MTQPRGIRNNNPGNIEAGIEWQGLALPGEMSGEQTAEGRFAVFKAPEYGIRAMAKLIAAYRTKYGINTISGIINRWAPPSDGNDSGAYASAVAAAVGVSANAVIDTTDIDVLEKIIAAMIKHENGEQPYPAEKIRAGIALAGGPVMVKPAPGGVGAIAKHQAKIEGFLRHILTFGGGFLVAEGLASPEQFDQLKSSFDILMSPETIGAVTTIVGVLWSVFSRSKKIGNGDMA